ncbi:hypothetical protein [Kozakia baliensis]|uniref:Uncharacterized protein n=1 Tax=Kozakia baliensis TaxID=153496 RepID=A0A1D8UUJ6_9PROT|nr:hypothetical protein [Kozakia baliensis]AOX17309.1 hypothetical protein A0U89_09365 [Kozakia baliensis]AOX20186.1 hypothetical protein A0U90_07655 [Kozakia baliensis]GBR30014.1 rod shape-determining protein MreD [Kozakia baliensis NRIC 0488]GEL63259.1 hypothetical protein KBA01_05450 [Kozakia baliensis]
MVAEHSRPEAHPGIAPKPTLRRRVDMAIRTFLPSIFIVLCALLLSAPFDVPGQAELIFGVAFGTVYFWSANRPASMTAPMVFIVGVIVDLLSFGPPGTLLFSVLVAHGVAHTWRYGLSRINFVFAWGLLAGLALILSLFQWVMACIGALNLLSPAPSLFQAALTIGIYPSLNALFVWARRTVADPEKA